MPSQSPSSLPLTVTVLAALWVSVGRCGVSESWGPGCDNGKLSLEMDLLTDLYLDCSVSAWQHSAQMQPSIDTTYGPEPARQMCMNKPISYNHTIPSSGAYRPVGAESGEYWFCPPQRWLNNLQHGAIVLLYHPCVSLHERHLLSVLARSCLSDYIITPHPRLKQHMPIALVSWGRTLELSAVASADVCDWLETTASTRNKLSGGKHIREYNLLLTWPANQHRLLRTHPDEQQSMEVKESLRRCCEQTMSSLLNETMEAELESSVKKESLNIKEGRSRQIRAAITEVQKNAGNKGNNKTHKSTNQTNTDRVRNAGGIQNYNNKLRQSEDSHPQNRKLSDPPGPKEVPSQSEIQSQNQSLTQTTIKSDSLASDASESQKNLTETAAQHPDLKNTEPQTGRDVKPEGNKTVRPEALVYSLKDEGTDSKEKNYDKHMAAGGKMKDNELVDVKERELDHKQTPHSATDSQHKSESSGFDSLSKSHSASPPQPQQPDARAAVVKQGLPRTPRTDEAVWAAAALGFLLVLLTLSVLHTRLYRHWRTMPSLYWHDPQQDYDSVADVIQRRQQIAKRRRKRGRRKECVLLPSSSSSDELP
ncbi:hypothetical protein JOB18_007372 [Solea senegalensis]|uniref:Tumor protein p53-inducible protein 13 n=2 Tax=Solea senegalensis TaxID=28829 RepID=A0AAV6PZF5_SOLSE|nr:uncharacterized protein tp53i13 [Solea senegalensis]KAG7478749.1 hypothetical protein JOB18_007372 [Solea senegalensis]